MRFLANENVPPRTVRRLRSAGHDISAIAEESPGITDTAVIQQAIREDRIILTFDRDYGELIFVHDVSSPPGLVYIRRSPASSAETAEIVLRVLASGTIDLRPVHDDFHRPHSSTSPAIAWNILPTNRDERCIFDDNALTSDQIGLGWDGCDGGNRTADDLA